MTTLEAGPALDILVAEKVMKWKVQPPNTLGGILVGTHRYITAGRIDVRVGGTKGHIPFYPWQTPFNPSTDITHAFEVVDHLRVHYRRGVEILVNPGHIRVRIEYGEIASVVAETVPLAICLAALKSIGVPSE